MTAKADLYVDKLIPEAFFSDGHDSDKSAHSQKLFLCPEI